VIHVRLHDIFTWTSKIHEIYEKVVVAGQEARTSCPAAVLLLLPRDMTSDAMHLSQWWWQQRLS
jgi:hypothetical protein